jgi:hypothetical protein
MAQERLEQGELLGGQLDLTRSAADAPRGGVELQVAGGQRGGPLTGLPPRDRAQAREQLGKGEGLGEVVVGAAVEPGHAILHGVAGGQHQHRRPDALGAQAPADLEAVDARQHHVEDHGVVGRGLGHPDGVLALDRDVGGQSLLAETAADQARHLHLVLDDEHPHRRPPWQAKMSGV